jgi:hypothetical protein
VSSRLVIVRLKLVSARQRIPGGSRERSDIFATVISAYAPTAKTPQVKQRFSEDLQVVVDKVPASDVLILLGDLNARVDRRNAESDLWQRTLRIYGLHERNDAGEEFLEFCAFNRLTVMNSWFQKKELYLGTWMHPATKKQHTIDLVIMREKQRMFCTDVRVMRGANCWSDHCMVRPKLRVKVFSRGNKRDSIRPFATHLLCRSTIRDDYRRNLTNKLLEIRYENESTVEHNWKLLKGCILEAGEGSVGRAKETQPDWFL